LAIKLRSGSSRMASARDASSSCPLTAAIKTPASRNVRVNGLLQSCALLAVRGLPAGCPLNQVAARCGRAVPQPLFFAIRAVLDQTLSGGQNALCLEKAVPLGRWPCCAFFLRQTPARLVPRRGQVRGAL